MMKMLLAVVLFGCLIANGDSAERELGLATIVGYQPTHDVRDYAEIDKDLRLILELFEQAKEIKAKEVYNLGAFSRTYATLHFGFQGLPEEIAAHSPVTVASTDGETMLAGMVLEKGKFGAKSVRILYDNVDNPEKCYVGGHPDPVVEGCFPASGHIRFDGAGKALKYSYNVLNGNANDRTLALFSTQANSKMKPCSHCQHFAEYKRFFQFYGRPDYAHRWIMSAFEATRTVFDSSVSDFTIYSLESRAQAAMKAVVTMDVFMYTIRMLEEAVHKCRQATEEKGEAAEKTHDKALKSLDGAVAFYAGSLEDGTGSGEFLYALADSECKEFKTCGPSGDSTKGTAKVNHDILLSLDLMQANVTSLHCSEARKDKDDILWKMRVPLIQGTMRYAFMREHKQVTGTEKAVGSAFAASIVPLVAACNYQDAETIGDAMETMTKTTDFTMVKSAFEKNYACLAVTCSDVGGYWDADKNQYHKGADPCTFDVKNADNNEDDQKTIGWAVAVPLFVIIAVWCFVKRRKSRKKKKKRGGGGIFDEEISDYSSSSDDSDIDFRFS